jgi:hypothetical protein
VTELIVFGPAILGAAAVVVIGRRLLARAGLEGRAATVTAVLAGAAAAATWLVFVVDALLYAVGENGPDYYEFSTYEEYRDVANEWPWFAAVALGYAILSAGLTLATAVVWRRVHPSAGAPIAVAAAVAVALPMIVPGKLPRVEYGKDPVLYSDPQRQSVVEPVLGRQMVCIAYGVQGIYQPGTLDPVPPRERLCLPVHESAIRVSPTGVRHYDVTAFYGLVEELNDAGIEPRETPDLRAEGLEPSEAVWTAG